MTAIDASAFLRAWQEQGYLVLRQVLDRERIGRLCHVCESVYEQWQAGSTADNQPGGFCYGPRGWVLLHLNHPCYHRNCPDGLRLLLEAIADKLVQEALAVLFRDAPLFLQANYYVDPAGEGWEGAWHRDCQFFAEGSEDRVRQLLAEESDPPREIHMHIPLIPTQASELVPGSHLRYDNEVENAIRLRDSASAAMPGAVRLDLTPGDLAFFHVNTLHRGTYRLGVPRRTIAVSYGQRSFPRVPTVEWMRRMRGYAASYQPWFRQTGYLDGLQPAARVFFERFIEIYGPYWGEELLVPEIGEQRIAYYRNA